MPIKDLSDEVRLPRLGKIHLGYRDPNRNNAPVKTDYFVFPKDHSDLPALVKLFGEKPKELRILIPVEDEELWASQYYKSYNRTYGLVCKGDGETALRVVNAETGELPDARKPAPTIMKEMPCKGKECPEYKTKKCSEVMNLRFILPEVPGLGVWQIDTGSINSILNINSCAKMIKKAFGRISLIPLKLTLEPIEVNNPETSKKQTVYVLNLRTNVTLSQLADVAREQGKTLLLEQKYDMEAAWQEKIEDDLSLWDEPGAEPQKKQVEAQVVSRQKAEDAKSADELKEELFGGETLKATPTEAAPDPSAMTENELLEQVAERKAWVRADRLKLAKGWLVNACKIAPERLTKEPQAVYKEVAELNGWK